MHNQINYGMFSGIMRLPSYWKQERIAHERAMELLSIFGHGGSCGRQGRLPALRCTAPSEIVRALGTNPSLLLLDELAV